MTFIEKLIRKLFSLFGLSITKIPSSHGSPETRATTEAAFRSLLKRKYQINTVIDIGASDGRWSKTMMQFYPKTQYLLIEAQVCHQQALNTFIDHYQNAQYVLAAAGKAPGSIYFDASNPFGGQASSKPFARNNIEVPVTTLDIEVANNRLVGPFLIKFDTHGFEVPILEGAAQTLKETTLIIMECYLHRLTQDSLLFNEMCDYLDHLGFRCIDMVDPAWRTYDDTFWQMDLIFIKKDSPEFSHPDYE
jgi:FkbM family methyltransferase